MKVQGFNDATKNLLLAALGSGNMHIPGGNSDGPKVSDEFFQHCQNKTLQVEILSVGKIAPQGVVNGSGIPTGKQKFSAVCELRAGSHTSKMRINIADLAAATDGKITLTFNVFKSDTGSNAGKSYLWCECPQRVTDPTKLTEFVNTLEVLTPEVQPA